ncbi:MAG: CotH kinase family protein [Lachnospiraceae bacterium]|nr:CotH kinase family protein [Lachnospiraceae bacterium]
MDEQGDLTNLYVTNVSRGGSSGCREKRIEWYYNASDNTYYLFMPSYSNMTKLRLGLEGTDHIYLDGNRIAYQDQFSLTTGDHIVTVENGEQYALKVMESENLPAIFIDTESGSLVNVHENKENSEKGDTFIMNKAGEPMYFGELDGFKVHGNIGLDESGGEGSETPHEEFVENNKLSYQMKLSKKANLFDMGEARKWLLISNTEDYSLMRNYITYNMAKAAGVDFVTDTQYVDLYINGVYRGNYLLTEKVEVGENRVNITDLGKNNENANKDTDLSKLEVVNPTDGEIVETEPGTAKWVDIPKDPLDITGGYLMELDTAGRYWPEPSGFVTSRNQAVVVKNPEYASEAEIDYIRRRYQEFEDALYAEDGVNPETGFAYYEYCDVDSFAKKYLVEEICGNLDANITSQNIYKYSDTVDIRLKAGPVWDYDRAWGNFGEIYGFNYADFEGLTAMQPITAGSVWYGLYQHPEYYTVMVEHYYKDFHPYLDSIIQGGFNEVRDMIETSAVMDKIRWGLHGTTDQEEMKEVFEYHTDMLDDFIRHRVEYLDTQW